MTRPVALGIVVRDDGEVLMLRRIPGGDGVDWVFPGGKVEPGESPEEACVREVAEEAGVTCRVERTLGGRVHPVTGREISYWLCAHEAGEPSLREPDKADRVGWFTPERALALAGEGIFPPVAEVLGRPAVQAPGTGP